jgi:putative CocE/NonD family hydrolase
MIPGVRYALGSTAVMAALLIAAPAAAAGPDLKPRPAQYPQVSATKDVPIPMSDGVTLYADVYRPADASGAPVPGRFPGILTQTPYNKQSANAGGDLGALAGGHPLLVRRGYVQIAVDVRGTGSSQGAWDSFGAREQQDSGEIAAWLRSQSWSDGTFGTYGFSYMGINQFFTAAQKPPGLKALFAGVPAEDVYRDVTWHGGALDAGFIPLWLGIVGATKLLPPGYAVSDPAQYAKLLLDRVSKGANFSIDATGGLVGGDLAYDGPFYRLRSPGTVVRKVDVPTFIAGGWWDLFQRGEPRLYNGLPLRPGRKQLLMGPWYHITAGEGLGEKGTPPDLQVLSLAWFDRWIKGIRNGVEHFGPVTLYELGAERYTTQRTFPRRDIRYERLYLRAEKSGSAQSLNDGTLSRKPPAKAGSDTGDANAANGLCTRSTVQWTAALVPPGQPCETDNRTQERTSFTYTTPPMSGDFHVSGPLSVTLRGSTTARDTTWIATVTDVGSGGASSQLTAGWLLASRRALDRGRSVTARNGDLVAPFHPFTRASLERVEPGKAETLNIEVFNTDAVVKRGHRLRLTISSGDVPHLVAPGPAFVNSAGAVDTVQYGPGATSFVTIPVVQRDARRVAIVGVGRSVGRSRALGVRLNCPDTEFECEVALGVSARGTTLGRRRLQLDPGTTRSVTIRLSRRKLGRLGQPRSLAFRTAARLLDEVGVAATTTKRSRARIRRR